MVALVRSDGLTSSASAIPTSGPPTGIIVTAEKHTVLVLNPGHFHAALTLRRSHPRLSDDVYVYAEDGPDVDSFLRMVESFNRRSEAPTHWRLQVFRGTSFLDRLRAERRGDIVIMAGKNRDRMATIRLL